VEGRQLLPAGGVCAVSGQLLSISAGRAEGLENGTTWSCSCSCRCPPTSIASFFLPSFVQAGKRSLSGHLHFPTELALLISCVRPSSCRREEELERYRMEGQQHPKLRMNAHFNYSTMAVARGSTA